jgi:hypothetical protein
VSAVEIGLQTSPWVSSAFKANILRVEQIGKDEAIRQPTEPVSIDKHFGDLETIAPVAQVVITHEDSGPDREGRWRRYIRSLVIHGRCPLDRGRSA